MANEQVPFADTKPDGRTRPGLPGLDAIGHVEEPVEFGRPSTFDVVDVVMKQEEPGFLQAAIGLRPARRHAAAAVFSFQILRVML